MPQAGVALLRKADGEEVSKRGGLTDQATRPLSTLGRLTAEALRAALLLLTLALTGAVVPYLPHRKDTAAATLTEEAATVSSARKTEAQAAL